MTGRYWGEGIEDVFDDHLPLAHRRALDIQWNWFGGKKMHAPDLFVAQIPRWVMHDLVELGYMRKHYGWVMTLKARRAMSKAMS